MSLTIAYVTSRKECHADWFFDSLHGECGGDYTGIQTIVIDFWNQPMPDMEWTTGDVLGRGIALNLISRCPEHSVVPPMPCVWQGPSKLSRNHYFAASNSRNTALCLAIHPNIAFVDDLSVLLPGWLASVRQSIRDGYVMAGAFRKVKKLVVEDGAVVSFEDHPPGIDSRSNTTIGDVYDCPPNWLFGCSLCAPVEAFLKINGWPMVSCSTGIGGEDCLTGMALARIGCKIKYDRRAMTYESEEGHHVDNVLLRCDKGEIGTIRDKSHALFEHWGSVKRFDNDFCGMDLRELRRRVLDGAPFPIPTFPTADWFDGQKISEL